MVLGLYSNDSISILKQTNEAVDTYGQYDHRYEGELIETLLRVPTRNLIRLRPEHIEALQGGKMLAWLNNEYICSFVILENEED